MNQYLKKRLCLFLLIFMGKLAFPCWAQALELKIGLVYNNNDAVIGSTEDAILLNLFNNKIIKQIKGGEYFTVKNDRSLINIIDNTKGDSIGSYIGPIQLIPIKPSGFSSCNNKKYRGYLTIISKLTLEGITVINNVDLEDYLLSVVPSEMPHTWHKEALKAQTVAARTYAIGYLGRRSNKGYDLESSVEDQVYLGIESEKESTSQAVKNTKGEILLGKNGKPIIALFHSSAGGYTDSIENIWDNRNIKPSAHIQPRPDYDDNSPYFSWNRKYTIGKLNETLSKLMIGEIQDIIALKRSPSKRITKVKVIGSTGEKNINGDDFRRLLKLPSSKFNFTITDQEIVFAGRGHGHGLGLSQWGAKELAENGFSYKEILAHYYTGTTLTKYPKSNHPTSLNIVK